MATLKALFSRQWHLSTLVVLVGMAVCIRLGFWQLGRQEERRAQNRQTTAVLDAPPLALNADTPLPGEPEALRYRRVVAQGTFDFPRQVAIKSQLWYNNPGVNLVAPLLLAGGGAVLVDRGWIPYDESAPERWAQFDETGVVTVTGFLKPSQTLRPSQATARASQPRTPGPQSEFYRVEIAEIQPQIPYPLLPVYILQSPPPGGSDTPPLRAEPEFDLSDGPHLGYALMWFSFSLILGGGYLNYIRKNGG